MCHVRAGSAQGKGTGPALHRPRLHERRSMDTKNRPRLSARTGLAALALVLVIGAIWAATALAAGGSSPAAGSTSVGSGGSPSSLGLVATTPQPAAPSGDDCPGHGGLGSGSGGGSSTTDGSSSTSAF
jgi:hypothetical protein